MHRRNFLALGAAATVAAAQEQAVPVTVAGASIDTTPRVSLVLSSFKGGETHDGTPIPGLEHPRPTNVDLSSAELDAMVRKAISLAALRSGDLATTVEADAWVVIKTHIPTCFSLGSSTSGGTSHRYVPGAVTDPRIVRSLIFYLAERKRGLRFTIVEGSPEWKPVEQSGLLMDGWNSEWGGAFDRLSYRNLVAECRRRFPGIRFEIVDLNFAETVELPVPGRASARHNPSRLYHVPKVVQQCDRLISVAPLKTDPASGVALSIGNYLGIAPGSRYGFPKRDLLKLGSIDEVTIDLFSYHPADFSIVGGCYGLEGGGTSVHHNLVIAGAKAPCVDAVAAAAMGFNPRDLPFLQMADRKGFGTHDPEAIWTWGNEPAEARREFHRPAKAKPRQAGPGK